MNKGRSTLFISDLDGTLLDPTGHVSAESARLLNEAIAGGTRFSIATARTPATVAALMSGVRMNLPAVVMTGAALWDAATGRYSRTRFIAPDTARTIVGEYRRHGVSTFLYTLEDELIQIYHIGPMSDLERKFLEERNHSPYKRDHVPPSGDSELPENLEHTLLFYGMQPDAPARRLYESLRRIEDCNPLCYHDIYGEETAITEVFSPRATKADAARALARGIGCDRIVAFGDNINDLPLLRAADVAVAVENAIPEVKEMADIVIDPNSEDSVARFISSFK